MYIYTRYKLNWKYCHHSFHTVNIRDHSKEFCDTSFHDSVNLSFSSAFENTQKNNIY